MGVVTPGVPPNVLRARQSADLLVSPEAVQRAIDQLSVRLTLRLQDTNPLLLIVMHGGLPYGAELVRRFTFPLEYGYLHVGRYGRATQGDELHWQVEPTYSLAGRTVLLVDDILDRGITLMALEQWAERAGAAAVITTVLVDKAVSATRPIAVDYAALECPDRFVFGCGMDYQGYWRNLTGIYALPDSMVEQ